MWSILERCCLHRAPSFENPFISDSERPASRMQRTSPPHPRKSTCPASPSSPPFVSCHRLSQAYSPRCTISSVSLSTSLAAGPGLPTLHVLGPEIRPIASWSVQRRIVRARRVIPGLGRGCQRTSLLLHLAALLQTGDSGSRPGELKKKMKAAHTGFQAS
jgi:hypothetical protein